MFTLQATHQSGARSGLYATPKGTIATPFFMPIATKGAVKTLSADDMIAIQQGVDRGTAPILLSNTYHLYIKPGLDVLQEAGGLHAFMKFPGVVLTDSGGFQIFSLQSLTQHTEEGVIFRSHRDGSTHHMNAEKSMEIQSIIGSDIWMAFDYFPGYPASFSQAKESVERTFAWAKRSKEWSDAYRSRTDSNHRLFGIIQGSTFPELRKKSAEEIATLDFDGYAIGGLAVGEPEEVMYDVIEETIPYISEKKMRYVMGTGMPHQILEAVKRGVDMFDCVLPTRNARHGSIFVHTEKKLVDADLSTVFYEKVSIRAAHWEKDFSLLDPYCSCMVCAKGYTKAYIRHLFSVEEPLAARLTTIHNITFYLQLMKDIRDVILSSTD